MTVCTVPVRGQHAREPGAARTLVARARGWGKKKTAYHLLRRPCLEPGACRSGRSSWRVPDELRASPQLEAAQSATFLHFFPAPLSSHFPSLEKKKQWGETGDASWRGTRNSQRTSDPGTHVAGLCRHSCAVRPSGDAAGPRRSSTFPRARSVRPPPQS